LGIFQRIPKRILRDPLGQPSEDLQEAPFEQLLKDPQESSQATFRGSSPILLGKFLRIPGDPLGQLS
jgi:hypothetical protein